MEKYWNELLFTLGKGDAKAMKEIAGFEVSEFFHYINNFEKAIKK